MRLIQTTDYHKLFCDDGRGLYVIVRNRVKYPDPGAFAENIKSALDRIIHPSYGLVFDSRDAVGRNEKAIVEVPKSLQDLLFAHITKVAILLATEVGVLQSKRIIEQDATDTMLSTRDADKAFAFAATR